MVYPHDSSHYPLLIAAPKVDGTYYELVAKCPDELPVGGFRVLCTRYEGRKLNGNISCFTEAGLGI